MTQLTPEQIADMRADLEEIEQARSRREEANQAKIAAVLELNDKCSDFLKKWEMSPTTAEHMLQDKEANRLLDMRADAITICEAVNMLDAITAANSQSAPMQRLFELNRAFEEKYGMRHVVATGILRANGLWGQ